MEKKKNQFNLCVFGTMIKKNILFESLVEITEEILYDPNIFVD